MFSYLDGEPYCNTSLVLHDAHPYRVGLRNVPMSNGRIGQVIEIKQGLGSVMIHLPASGIDALVRALEAVSQVDSDDVEVLP